MTNEELLRRVITQPGFTCRGRVRCGCLDVHEPDVLAQGLPGAWGYGVDVRDAASVRAAAECTARC